MSALHRPWLLVQGALLLSGVVLFGLGFPLLGCTMGLLDVAPAGEDPMAIAFVLGLAGPITALVYLPGAVLALLAARRVRNDAEGAFPLVLAASIAGSVVCLLGIAPVVLYLVGRDRP